MREAYGLPGDVVSVPQGEALAGDGADKAAKADKPEKAEKTEKADKTEKAEKK